MKSTFIQLQNGPLPKAIDLELLTMRKILFNMTHFPYGIDSVSSNL